MSNILDYLVWRGDLPFSKNRINEVDKLILMNKSDINNKLIEKKYYRNCEKQGLNMIRNCEKTLSNISRNCDKIYLKTLRNCDII